jgi:uncharacterized membrane protein
MQTATAMTDQVVSAPVRAATTSQRIATIDWMRGLVMVLMILDHVSMAFDGTHISHDSAMYADASTMALPAAEFFTRWMTRGRSIKAFLPAARSFSCLTSR